MACPHCGRPNISTKEKEISEGSTPNLINITKAIIVITVFLLLAVSTYFYFKPSPFFSSKKYFSAPTPLNNDTQVPLQEVQNLGYDFYLGEIETVGVTNINDNLKNQITKIAYNAHFPTSRLKNIPIIILNNLALTGNQYISINGVSLKVPDLSPSFLSEGGIYSTYSNSSAVIFINKPIIAQGQLTYVLTHELGHAVDSTLSDKDWATFYKLRGIPIDTKRHGSVWNTSPQEDFAEVYQNTFTGQRIQTYFGVLIPKFGSDMGHCSSVYFKAQDYYTKLLQQQTATTSSPLAFLMLPAVDFKAVENKANADKGVQACRREVMTNPSLYTSEWGMGGAPYVSSVDTATKNFISSIINKLN
jgi:hypothetical protein